MIRPNPTLIDTENRRSLMKTTIYKGFSTSALIILALASFTFGQTPEVEKAQAQVNKVLEDSGRLLPRWPDRSEAKPTFRIRRQSSINLSKFSSTPRSIFRKTRGSSRCYSQLIETIYLMEFPSDTKSPQLANSFSIVRMALERRGFQVGGFCGARCSSLRRKIRKDSAILAAAGKNGGPSIDSAVGFNSQEFEPSPLDELSRLELTTDEQDVESNPIAQAQYQYIQYAVANKSLGFSFQVHPMIQQYINYYRGRGRGTMEVGLYRSGMFMSMARRIFREEGVPENVAWLGQVESTWKPTALSWAAASGLWQFIPGTGARFGLRRTAQVDERNSFDEATRASGSISEVPVQSLRKLGTWDGGLQLR